jgi:hypothetical protein
LNLVHWILLSGLTSILNIATSSIIPPLEPLTSPESNPKIDKMIKYMKSKGYVVYEGIEF